MKKILHIIPLLLMTASCAKEPAVNGGTVPLDITVCTRSSAVMTKAADDQAVINSVRVLAFHKADGAASGSEQCVLNEFHTFGYIVSSDEAGNTLVNLTSTLTLGIHDPKVFEVFVVLNEEDYTLRDDDSTVDLHSSLDGIVEGTGMSTLTALLGKPATYTAGVTVEPAFLMSASKEVTIESANKPVKVSFNADSALRRSMAVITVDGIYSGRNAELSKYFVLDAAIVNVPKDMAWSSADGTSGTSGTLTLPLGSASETEGGTSYYERQWSGSVYKKVDVAVTRKDIVDARYYKTDGDWSKANSGDLISNDPKKTDYRESWSFAPTTPYLLQNPSPKDDPARRNVYKSALAHLQTIDATVYKDKNTKYSVDNLLTSLATIFTAADATPEDMKTYYEVTGYPENPGTYQEYCSDDAWTVDLGNTYYVPENISTNVSSATCIRVTLAVAEPSINLSGVAATDLPSPGEAFGSGDTGYYLDNTYYDKVKIDGKDTWVLRSQDFNLGQTTKEPKICTNQYDGKGQVKKKEEHDFSVATLFSLHGHVVNADNESLEYPKPTDEKDYPLDNNFHVYVDGFFRKTTGLSATTTVNQNSGAFLWNIPSVNDASTPEYEVRTFLIPVNNQLDAAGDYSVRRNTRYVVTLHVGDNTLAAMSGTPASPAATKASSDGYGDFGISAAVTTEKMDEDED